MTSVKLPRHIASVLTTFKIHRLFPVKRSDGKSKSKDHVLIMSDAMWKVQRNLFRKDEDNDLEGNI